MNKKIIAIVGLLSIIGTVFATYFFIDAQYARCADVKKLESRLDYKIENDKFMAMRQRSWQIEERYPQMERAPSQVQQQYKELQSDLEMQKNKVQKMESK